MKLWIPEVIGSFKSMALSCESHHKQRVVNFVHDNFVFRNFDSHKSLHNIIQIHNNVWWDWQYYVKYSPCPNWMWGIFHRILSFPHSTVMDMNNVMLSSDWLHTKYLHFNSPSRSLAMTRCSYREYRHINLGRFLFCMWVLVGLWKENMSIR